MSKVKYPDRGVRFTHWTVLRPGPDLQGKSQIYRQVFCQCDCGRWKNVLLHNLLNGLSRSCGCTTFTKKKGRYKHGLSGSYIYQVWVYRVKRDCVPEWLDIQTFIKDIGERKARYFVKIDRSKPFSKDNFMWGLGPWKKGKYIECFGMVKSSREWAKYLGVSRQRLFQRLNSKPTIEEALTPYHEPKKLTEIEKRIRRRGYARKHYEKQRAKQLLELMENNHD